MAYLDGCLGPAAGRQETPGPAGGRHAAQGLLDSGSPLPAPTPQRTLFHWQWVETIHLCSGPRMHVEDMDMCTRQCSCSVSLFTMNYLHKPCRHKRRVDFDTALWVRRSQTLFPIIPAGVL